MRRLVWTTVLAVGLSGRAEATAQDRNPGARPAPTKSSTPKSSELPTGGAGPDLDNRPVRPGPNPMQVKNVPPELMSLLKDWEVSSAKIKKLEGEHHRWEYDYVFNVVKHNTGKFYYESPDKGRIDLTPFKDDVGVVESKRHWETGQPVKFKGVTGAAERWFCDGQLVTQVDVDQKQATRMVLPKQNQGVNIIDGPLPFLFGMPAQKAIQRYDLELKSRNTTTGKATIRATPLWPTDSANYQLAEIILDTKTFLPSAVRLIDPAGTKETVFVFGKFEKNSKDILQKWLGNSPFKFEDRSYKIVTKTADDERAEQDGGTDGKVIPAGGVRPAANPATQSPGKSVPKNGAKSKLSTLPAGTVPSLVGVEHTQAKEILKTLGYKVLLKRGSPANRDEQTFHVERQQPEPRAKLPEGETVTLFLFTEPQAPE